MAGMSQLEMYENHPLYRDMLKAILMSQIQGLLDQLSSHIGEETVILTASIEDGKITDIGTECGRAFLKGHNDIKTDFLGFCLKRHYEKQSDESTSVTGQKNSICEKSNTNKELKNNNSSIKQVSDLPKKSSHAENQHDRHDTAPLQVWDKFHTDHTTSPEERSPEEYFQRDDESPQDDIMNEEYPTICVKTEPIQDYDDYTGMLSPAVNDVKEEQSPLAMRSSSRDAKKRKDGVLKNRDENSPTSIRQTISPSQSLQDQISSKRKQKAPKRMKFDDIDANGEVMNLAVNSDPDSTPHKSASQVFTWKVDQPHKIDGLSVKSRDEVVGPYGFGAENYGLGTSSLIHAHGKDAELWRYEIPYKSKNLVGTHSSSSSEDVSAGFGQSAELNGINLCMSNSGHGDESNTSLGGSPRVVDGVLVTRGIGRYEKLLKCEQCGKICRTSNMARHKKRYCIGCPKVKSVEDY